MNYFYRVAAQCRECKNIVISCHRHDYRPCGCGDIAIDGGTSYTRLAYKKAMPIVFRLKVKDMPSEEIDKVCSLDYSELVNKDQFTYSVNASKEIKKRTKKICQKS